MSITREEISAVILAGGQARRLKGQDKGLLCLNQKPLVKYVVEKLKTHVKTILISANKNQDKYKKFAPVIRDDMHGFQGPLAGFAKAMKTVASKYLLILPCDSPLIEDVLIQRLKSGLIDENADISVAFDGQRLQPVFAILKTNLLDNLLDYIEKGNRKIDLWYKSHKMAQVDMSDHKHCFINLNTPEDFARLTHTTKPPVLGFAAFSGTGKTYLLTQLIKRLKQQNLRLAIIKHAHHDFDIDYPGKDSYELRKAGADQVLIASHRRSALISEYNTKTDEPPQLKDLIKQIDVTQIDLILVEGFKKSKINKIELQRCKLNQPDLYKEDENIIALASDKLANSKTDRILLDLNNIDEICRFILAYAHF